VLCCFSREDCREESSVPSVLTAGPSPPDTQDDFMLAQMLQLEYDKEHDLKLKADEKHFNKHSKGINLFQRKPLTNLIFKLYHNPIVHLFLVTYN